MNKYNRCKMCVSGITECSITGTSSPEANLWFDAGNNTERHRHINACKNKRWKFKAYRSNGGNFSLKQANVCCVYWTRKQKTVCLCTAEWKIVLRRLPWEKRSLCRAGFEMTGKPKPMRKKERETNTERESNSTCSWWMGKHRVAHLFSCSCSHGRTSWGFRPLADTPLTVTPLWYWHTTAWTY